MDVRGPDYLLPYTTASGEIIPNDAQTFFQLQVDGSNYARGTDAFDQAITKLQTPGFKFT